MRKLLSLIKKLTKKPNLKKDFHCNLDQQENKELYKLFTVN